MDVAAVDEYAEKVEAGGGAIVTPKHTAPGGGYVAYFKDYRGQYLRDD